MYPSGDAASAATLPTPSWAAGSFEPRTCPYGGNERRPTSFRRDGTLTLPIWRSRFERSFSLKALAFKFLREVAFKRVPHSLELAHPENGPEALITGPQRSRSSKPPGLREEVSGHSAIASRLTRSLEHSSIKGRESDSRRRRHHASLIFFGPAISIGTPSPTPPYVIHHPLPTLPFPLLSPSPPPPLPPPFPPPSLPSSRGHNAPKFRAILYGPRPPNQI